MFIVEVIPIKRGSSKESLSYFSASKVATGSLVKASLRSKLVWGVVISCSPAAEQKALLKASSFTVRKIPRHSQKNQKLFFPEWWMRAAAKIALYFSTTTGSVIALFTPAPVLENIVTLVKLIPPNNTKLPNGRVRSEILCIQTEDRERFGYYKRAIREEFAKKHSIFLCLRTLEDIKKAVSHFKKGIEKYTFVFHSGQTRLELVERWSRALLEEHPILIIATAQWLSIPRSDLGTIILDKEGSLGWKTLSRPYIDMRKAVEFFAKERGVRLILGDSVLDIETIWRYKSDEISAFEPVKFRLTSPVETSLVSMKSRNLPEDRSFKIISTPLAELLKRTRDENKNIFIYATRKGLASVTVCNDCGEEVLCHNCSSPVVLYKASAEKMPISAKDGHLLGNTFRCHQCGSVRSAKELCKKCGSWRLMPLGVGIERAIEEVEKMFPDPNTKTNILVISKDATTQSKAAQVAEKFYRTPGSILVGTEMAFYYLKSPVDFTAVGSIDSLFSVPDFRIREKIFHLILNMKLLAREQCLVQIRGAEKTTIELALSGNLLDFYKMEIEDRRLLQYPPFSVFIKITVRGERDLVNRESQFLQRYFDKWNPVVFESHSERRDSPAAYNCVIKVPRGQWPDPELLPKILSLPPHFEIKVDPDNLL